MAIAQLIRKDFNGGKSLSGIGGVETGRDAAEFLLLGADTVQVPQQCTGFSSPGLGRSAGCALRLHAADHG